MALYGGIVLPGKPSLENVRKLDLLPIPMIRKIHRYGIAIDREYLYALSSELGTEMASLQRDISSYIPPAALDSFTARSLDIDEDPTINANSADQIRNLLFEVLHVGRNKQLKTTSTGKVSTGKKQLELVKEDHPVVQKVLEYRERAKLKSTYADTLPARAKLHPRSSPCPVCELPHTADTWRVHTEFLLTRTETGRIASKSPNLQNIPVRSELGRRLRAAFVASPGTRFVSTDFSQIELRDLAHLSNAKSMIEVYRQNGDIHVATAMGCFGISDPADVDPYNHRLPCKTINFAIVYGITAKALSSQLSLQGVLWTEEECDVFIGKWFDLYPEVRSYMELQHYRARRYGFVWDAFGRVRRVPETRSCHAYIRSAGLRQAGNVPEQATSAGQTKLVMGELQQDFDNLTSSGVWVWPLLTIHDQLIVEAEEDNAESVRDLMTERFNNVMVDKDNGTDYWRVPIRSDGEILERWKKG